jgi:hypothetical protein
MELYGICGIAKLIFVATALKILYLDSKRNLQMEMV